MVTGVAYKNIGFHWVPDHTVFLSHVTFRDNLPHCKIIKDIHYVNFLQEINISKIKGTVVCI